MGYSAFLQLTAVIAALFAMSCAQNEKSSCRACNCQFSNIDVITNLIDAKLNRALANFNSSLQGVNETLATIIGGLSAQPAVKMVYIGVGGGGISRTVRMQPRSPSTWVLGNPRTDLAISDTNNSYTSSNNLVAYRPNYQDSHSSNLAVLFVNLQGLFPCLSGANFHPACSIFTSEEDGFRKGKPIIQAADIGNHFRIFSSSSNMETFGFGVAGCSTFDSSCVSSMEVELVCLLPSSVCN